MEVERDVNNIILRGKVAGAVIFSHESHLERFYQFPLAVERLSGNEDVLNIQLPWRLLGEDPLEVGREVEVRGSVRTFNNRSGVGSRLVITVLAAAVEASEEAHTNQVTLRGTVCRRAEARRTPLGREICDFTLAVNRRYGRADYFPCIAWGKSAQFCATLPVGSRLALEGRLQSRAYIKQYPDHSENRVAYEVSVMELHTEPTL